MKRITYIGDKPVKTDTVTRSGLRWGPGETLDVDDLVASQLLKYPDVWREGGAKPIQPKPAPAPKALAEAQPAEAKEEAETEVEVTRDYLDSLTAPEIRKVGEALNKTEGVNINLLARDSRDTLIDKIMAVVEL